MRALVHARKQRRAAGGADRRRDEGVAEADPFAGQRVDVRRADDRVDVSHGVPPLVVGQNEEDVGALRGGGLLRLRGTCGQQRAGAGCQPVQKEGFIGHRPECRSRGVTFRRGRCRKAASLRTARPRCDTAFFSSGDISAKVRSQPSGTKSGS